MQVTLFKSLKSVHMTDEHASAVVAELEEYIDKMIGNANRPLEAKLESLRNQLTVTNILLTIIGLGVVLSPIVAKLIH